MGHVIKFIGAAVWICIATLGAVYFSFQMAGAKPATPQEQAESMMGGLDYVRTEVMSVPLIQNGAINGYFLARLVYTVDPQDLKKLTVPAESIITDVVYSYIFGDPALDFTKIATLDLDAFRNGVRERINKQVKFDLVKDVLVEQIDYLSKDEIRDNAVRRRSQASAKAEPEEEEKPAGKDAKGKDAPAH